MLSRAAHYAITGLLRFSLLPSESYCRVDDLVAGTDAPRHAVAKVFHGLAQRGLLESIRGTRGGFRLAEGTQNRTLAEIIEAVEGPPRVRGRIDRGLCLPDDPCPLEELLAPAAELLRQTLTGTRLVDLARRAGPSACCCQRPQAHASASGGTCQPAIPVRSRTGD